MPSRLRTFAVLVSSTLLVAACGSTSEGGAVSDPTAVSSISTTASRAPSYSTATELVTALGVACPWKQATSSLAEFTSCAEPAIDAMVFHGGGEPMTEEWIATWLSTPEDECLLWSWLRDQAVLARRAVLGAAATTPSVSTAVIGPRWLVLSPETDSGAAWAASSGGHLLVAPTRCVPTGA